MKRNEVECIGRVTRDPKVRYLPSGKPVTEFGIAIDQSYKNQQTGEWVKRDPIFVDIKAWEDYGSVFAQAGGGKGIKVHVVGRLGMDEWQDKQTGQKRSKVYVTASQLTVSNKDGKFEETDYGYSEQPPAQNPQPRQSAPPRQAPPRQPPQPQPASDFDEVNKLLQEAAYDQDDECPF